MAEFCPECWNEINDFSDSPEGYLLSWAYELCEGCGEYKRVVVGRKPTWLYLLCKFWGKLKRRPGSPEQGELSSVSETEGVK